MSQSQMLYRLQQIDTQLDQALGRTNEIEKILAGNTVLQQAESALLNVQQRLQTELISLRRAEQSVQDQYVKIAQTEAALYGGKIRLPKELQDLQNEVAALKRHLVKLEDSQLDCMLAVEDAQSMQEQAALLYDQANSAWVEQTAQLHNEHSQIQNQITRLESERVAALGSISEELLTLYENLRKQRNGVAVVVIAQRNCGACGTMLTPAVLQSVQSSSTVIRCPTCNRILYPG
jgi:hypothetical protein